jgi:hypothetical protein
VLFKLSESRLRNYCLRVSPNSKVAYSCRKAITSFLLNASNPYRKMVSTLRESRPTTASSFSLKAYAHLYLVVTFTSRNMARMVCSSSTPIRKNPDQRKAITGCRSMPTFPCVKISFMTLQFSCKLKNWSS